MKLLFTKRSPYARKVRVFAAEKGIPLELLEEDLTNKSRELLSANPLGKIPTLILDNGETLADSSVICEYLEYLNPKPPLIPKDPAERFKALHLDSLAKGLMDVTVSIFYENLLHKESANKAFIETRTKVVQDCLKFFEHRVKELNDFNVASISLACAIGYIDFRFNTIWSGSQCPKLKEWYAKVSKRPSLAGSVPVA